MTCACGCGQLVSDPLRGGYNSRVQDRLWFASNECQARVEVRLSRYRAEHPDVKPVPIDVITGGA